MLTNGQNEQDNFARPTKDRSEDNLEEKFQYKANSGSTLTSALSCGVCIARLDGVVLHRRLNRTEPMRPEEGTYLAHR